jgi:hypothetical protein
MDGARNRSDRACFQPILAYRSIIVALSQQKHSLVDNFYSDTSEGGRFGQKTPYIET